jgi:hypothetical protein
MGLALLRKRSMYFWLATNTLALRMFTKHTTQVTEHLSSDDE